MVDNYWPEGQLCVSFTQYYEEPTRTAKLLKFAFWVRCFKFSRDSVKVGLTPPNEPWPAQY